MTQKELEELLKQLTDMEADPWCGANDTAFNVLASHELDEGGMFPVVIRYGGNYLWLRMHAGRVACDNEELQPLDLDWAVKHSWYLAKLGGESCRNIRRSMQCNSIRC